MRSIRLPALALAACLLGASAPSPSPGGPDEQYTAIARAYFDEGFRTQPIGATFAGLHTYDAQLGDFSAAAFGRQLAADRRYLDQLNALDAAALSSEVSIDRQILINEIQDDLLLNGTLGLWRHNPDMYGQAGVGSVFGIISRNYAPLSTRIRYVIARERQIPAMLQVARRNITTVDGTTKKIAAQDIAGAAVFFKETVPVAFAPVKDAVLQAQLKSANLGAMAALQSYAKWVGNIRPSGTYAIGADAYQKRLLYEDNLAIPLPEYLAVGQRELDRLRNEFVATAKLIDPKKTPLQVYNSLALVHPAPSKLLQAARQDLVRLRAFIIAHHIITLPPDADIKVVETPPFERATSTASMDSPGPLERVATQAYYNVTPVDPKWKPAQTQEYLAQFNDFERPIISAHEVYPGHYVNFVFNKHANLSLTRQLLWNPSFGEGWAHYDEQMMVDEGWGGGDPRVRLGQLEEALLRAARFVVGVKMHTQGMTVPQAVTFFVTAGLQPRQVGYEEALRGTQDPMYGYYTLGKLEILKLRADYKKKLGAEFTLEKFHDALLSHGDPPMPLLRPLLLGSDDDGKVL